MGAQFLELLKKVTVFMLAGQLIVHFLPAGGYEKYVKMMISIMVLSQIEMCIRDRSPPEDRDAVKSAMEHWRKRP